MNKKGQIINELPEWRKPRLIFRTMLLLVLGVVLLILGIWLSVHISERAIESTTSFSRFVKIFPFLVIALGFVVLEMCFFVEREAKKLQWEINVALEKEITERKQMEKELIRAERLAATAQIAAEAAHEIRNPLHVLNTGLYYLKMIADKGDDSIQQTIQRMDSALIRTTGFINDLLNFSRPIELKMDKVNINEMIKEAMDELPEEALTNIGVNQELSLDLPEIWADLDRIKQVIVNLIKNAAEAMTEVRSKKLEVRSGKEGEFIKISVSDTGKGIPEEDLSKIFDPFHTTKARGIGLGLAICQRFVEAHQGRIEAESKVGVGTTFVIKLPGKEG